MVARLSGIPGFIGFSSTCGSCRHVVFLTLRELRAVSGAFWRLTRQNHAVVERPSSAGPDNDGDVQQHGQQANEGEYLAVQPLVFHASFSRLHLTAWS
jgi:hypothetical protein